MKGDANVSAAPVRAVAHSAARRPESSSVLGILIVLLTGCLLALLGLFGFAVGFAHCSIDGAPRGRKPVSEADPSQHAVGVEPLVEPLSTEQADHHAERDLEAQGPVAAEGFPVLLHR